MWRKDRHHRAQGPNLSSIQPSCGVVLLTGYTHKLLGAYTCATLTLRPRLTPPPPQAPSHAAMLRCATSGRRRAFHSTAQQLLTVLVVLLAASPATEARPIRFLKYPVPSGDFDRSSMAGMAKGARAQGQPDPVQGLVNPDVPALSNASASMEGESS